MYVASVFNLLNLERNALCIYKYIVAWYGSIVVLVNNICTKGYYNKGK